MRRNPPLPSAVRPLYWTFRVLGTLFGAAAATLAVLYATQGHWAWAVIVFVIGLSFAGLTWLHPTSRLFLPLLAVVGLAASYFLQSWLIAALLLSAIAWVVWSRRRFGPLPEAFEIVDANEMMKNAHKFVEAFEGLGFKRIAAYRARIGRVPIIVSLLLGPDGRSYASVTDAIVDVTSKFSDGRSLNTRNSNVQALPDFVLINPVSGGAPEALVTAHARALETLSAHGHVPNVLSAPDLADIAVRSELDAIEWMKEQGRARRPADTKPLWEHPDLAARLAAWRG